VEVPVFAADGALELTPGYNSRTRVYYEPPAQVVVTTVPEKPTAEQVTAARELIVNDLLGEFPFVSDADKAHAVAVLVAPFVRDLIDGPTPGHMIEAPSPGSGKGLLTDVVLAPALGRRIGKVGAARDDAEWAKRLTGQLRESRAAIVIDNISRTLDSGILSKALTDLLWEERLLGGNEIVRLPVRSVWVATANNPTFTTELARRFVRIRLDPRVDRPWQREGFTHADLRGWALARRADLIGAALTLAQAWIAAGRPAWKGRQLGSYEE